MTPWDNVDAVGGVFTMRERAGRGGGVCRSHGACGGASQLLGRGVGEGHAGCVRNSGFMSTRGHSSTVATGGTVRGVANPRLWGASCPPGVSFLGVTGGTAP